MPFPTKKHLEQTDYSKNEDLRQNLTMILPSQTLPLMTTPNALEPLIHPTQDPHDCCLISHKPPPSVYIIQLILLKMCGYLFHGQSVL